jgi:hypothetical protein
VQRFQGAIEINCDWSPMSEVGEGEVRHKFTRSHALEIEKYSEVSSRWQSKA